MKSIVSYEEDLLLLEEIKRGNLDKQRTELKIKFPNEKFPGRFPVRTLMKNITEKYNTSSVSATHDLRDLTKNKQLNSNTIYSIEDDSLSLPYVIKESNGSYTIHLSESFSAYTWCLTYFFLLKS